jgi:alanine dehydrogenase
MTANIARTASRALVNVALPYIMQLANQGLDATLGQDAGLAQGVVMYRGSMVHPSIGRSFDIPTTPIEELLAGRGAS